jgi:hypothetical protein
LAGTPSRIRTGDHGFRAEGPVRPAWVSVAEFGGAASLQVPADPEAYVSFVKTYGWLGGRVRTWSATGEDGRRVPLLNVRR